jgi:hypothetical protein
MTLSDNYQTDKIICCNDDENCSLSLDKNTYFLIFAQDKFFNNFSAPYYCVEDNAIGNGLNNGFDKIILADENTVFVNFTYNVTVDKGNSFALINREWQEAMPTPGQENIAAQTIDLEKEPILDIEIRSNLPLPLYMGVEYSLVRVVNLAYPDIKETINATVFYNISRSVEDNILVWQNTVNSSFKSYTTNYKHIFNFTGEAFVCAQVISQNVDERNIQNNVVCMDILVLDPMSEKCNISLVLSTDKVLFEEGEKIYFSHLLNNESVPYEISYWIEDLFGKIVKQKTVTKNTNKKSYTPKIEGYEQAFIIKSYLYPACNNTNNNTMAEQIVVVRGTKVKTSRFSIKKISEQSKQSKIIKIEVYAYKGNTTKSSVKAYITDGKYKVSEITTLSLDKNYQEYELTIPLMLKDCIKAGMYDVVIEGLDKEEKEKIFLKNVPCQEKLPESAEELPTETTSPYELLTFTENITSECISLVRVTNTENSHSYSLWSYIYKGPISYSGERELNKIDFVLDDGMSRTVSLINEITNISGGGYSLKIKILRDDRKTPYEITRQVYVNTPVENIAALDASLSAPVHISRDSNSTFVQNTAEDSGRSDLMTGELVYESASQKIRKYSKYFVIVVFFLIVVALVKYK